eukprot:Lankesteria_metandrocarpae@DN4125_c0_g1_i3.p1
MLILGMHILVISRLVDIVCQWLELCGALQAEDFTIERLVLTTIFELLLVIFCFCWVLGIFNSLKLVLLVGGTGWECRNYQELQQDFTAGIIKRRIVRTRLVFGFIDICSSDCFKDVVSSNTALTQAQHTATCCPSTQPKKHDHDSATNRLQNLNNCKRSSAVEANILHSGVTTPALYSTSLTTTTSDASTALPVHLHIESPSSTDGCSPPSPSESQNTNALFTDGDTGGDLRRAHNGPWATNQLENAVRFQRRQQRSQRPGVEQAGSDRPDRSVVSSSSASQHHPLVTPLPLLSLSVVVTQNPTSATSATSP